MRGKFVFSAVAAGIALATAMGAPAYADNTDAIFISVLDEEGIPYTKASAAHSGGQGGVRRPKRRQFPPGRHDAGHGRKRPRREPERILCGRRHRSVLPQRKPVAKRIQSACNGHSPVAPQRLCEMAATSGRSRRG
jgi:hypothetical protein